MALTLEEKTAILNKFLEVLKGSNQAEIYDFLISVFKEIEPKDVEELLGEVKKEKHLETLKMMIKTKPELLRAVLAKNGSLDAAHKDLFETLLKLGTVDGPIEMFGQKTIEAAYENNLLKYFKVAFLKFGSTVLSPDNPSCDVVTLDKSKLAKFNFENTPYLKILEISNLLEGDVAIILSKAIPNLTNLSALYLDGNIILSSDAKALAEILPNLIGLRELHLNNYIRNDDAKELANILPSMSQLEILELNSNYIGGEGLKALAIALFETNTARAMRASLNIEEHKLPNLRIFVGKQNLPELTEAEKMAAITRIVPNPLINPKGLISSLFHEDKMLRI